MSDLISSPVIESKARPQPSATTGTLKSGKEIPLEAGKKVEVDRQSQEAVDSHADEKVDSVKVEHAVAQMQDYMQNMERSLNFQLDEESGITVIKVFDAETEELIRQIPNEEAVDLAQKLNDKEPLMLFSAKV